MKSIDLNADIGEDQPFDFDLLKIISSASVACGGHAGNDEIMATTLLAAKQAGVTTGAHPGFVDKENFGRVRLDVAADIIADQVVGQLENISGIARDVGQEISYVKLHGALYNWASEDLDLAKTLFSRIKEFDPLLSILALDNSAQIAAARALGMVCIHEAFADRAYDKEGHLLTRTQQGAVFDDPKRAVSQALDIAMNNHILTIEGASIRSKAQSLCLHGDNEAALILARAVRDGLSESGVKIKSVC